MKLGKRNQQKAADVTMDSFEGAKICDLVGLYIQSNLENILLKTNFGLCWDDGLILFRNLNGQQIDKNRKTITKKSDYNVDLKYTNKSEKPKRKKKHNMV